MTNSPGHPAVAQKHFEACRVDLTELVSGLDVDWSLAGAMGSLWGNDSEMAVAIERLHGNTDWLILSWRGQSLRLTEHHRVLGADGASCAVCFTRDSIELLPEHASPGEVNLDRFDTASMMHRPRRDPTWDLQSATNELRERDPNLYVVFTRLKAVADGVVSGRRADRERLQAHHQALATCDYACRVCADSGVRQLVKEAQMQWRHDGLWPESPSRAAEIMLADDPGNWETPTGRAT